MSNFRFHFIIIIIIIIIIILIMCIPWGHRRRWEGCRFWSRRGRGMSWFRTCSHLSSFITTRKKIVTKSKQAYTFYRYVFKFFITLFNTVSSAAPQIPLYQRMLGGIEPRTVATLPLEEGRSKQSARSHPQLGQISSISSSKYFQRTRGCIVLVVV